jgi:hypothetical protein
MKPTDQQQQWLKEYLNGVLIYRETFEEVYDHVITGLTTKTDIVSFEHSVNDIINNDFGGYEQLPKLEKAAKKAATKNSIKVFLTHFAGYFKFPSLLYVIAASVVTYYLILYLQIFSWNLWEILLLGVVIQIVPVFWGGNKIFSALKTRYNQTGEVFNHTQIKPSLKDGFFKRMAVTPFYLFLFINLILSLLKDGAVLSNNAISTGIALSITITVLYQLALKKLYSDDLETGIIRIILTTDHLKPAAK